WHAKRRFKQLDLHNISTRHGDGWEGWPSRGPFDGIIVTAAASDIPPALLSQLADNGRMVIPVGEQQQMLKLIRRRGNDFHTQSIGTVRFVPLIHGDLG
ncbi:protein-L-isoaspartate(D-aspartate) O-methyltransferase, partial [Salmonella enterica subsp. enterica serovar Eastbourne]|nr:protein-L-isoaspartate(D-aspartate) O-methyltransferase [Salmonella enterica subsp. enterica serovar Eastbourne]